MVNGRRSTTSSQVSGPIDHGPAAENISSLEFESSPPSQCEPRCSMTRRQALGGSLFGSAIEAPGHNAIRVDADRRTRILHDLGPPPDFDSSRPPRVHAGKVDDDDGSTAAARDVAILLRLFEIPAGDVDRFERGVVGPSDRCDVRRSVLTDGGDTA